MSEVETVVKEVETKAEAVVEEVKTVAEKVAEAVEVKAKTFISLETAEEKLVLKETELEYLKIQMQLKDLQAKADTFATKYKTTVDEYFVKYGVDKALYVFDGMKSGFALIQKDAKQFIKKL